MLGLAVLFLVIAIAAWAMGAGQASEFALTVAKWCVIIFVVLLVLSLVLGATGNPYWGWPVYHTRPVVLVP